MSSPKASESILKDQNSKTLATPPLMLELKVKWELAARTPPTVSLTNTPLRDQISFCMSYQQMKIVT